MQHLWGPLNMGDRTVGVLPGRGISSGVSVIRGSLRMRGMRICRCVRVRVGHVLAVVGRFMGCWGRMQVFGRLAGARMDVINEFYRHPYQSNSGDQAAGYARPNEYLKFFSVIIWGPHCVSSCASAALSALQFRCADIFPNLIMVS